MRAETSKSRHFYSCNLFKLPFSLLLFLFIYCILRPPYLFISYFTTHYLLPFPHLIFGPYFRPHLKTQSPKPVSCLHLRCTSKLQPTRCNISWFIYFYRRCTCFRRSLHPSSGAQNCTYNFRYCQPILLFATVVDETEIYGVPSHPR